MYPENPSVGRLLSDVVRMMNGELRFSCATSVLAALIPATPHEAVSNVPKAAQANERNPGARGHELRSQPGREVRPVDEVFVRGEGDRRARLSWLGRWLSKVHMDHPAVASLCAGDHIPAACRTVKDGPAHDCDANNGWCNERCRALLPSVFSARLSTYGR